MSLTRSSWEPTRSLRSAESRRVTGEVINWTRQTPESLETWRGRLTAIRADPRGEIIN